MEKGIAIFRDAGCAIALAMTLRQESSPSAFPGGAIARQVQQLDAQKCDFGK
ncbi:hypothetical protein LKK83_11545 [Phormidium sp. CCY1219]|nr:hypothetical protein [Phormidium sp. CCY1219]